MIKFLHNMLNTHAGYAKYSKLLNAFFLNLVKLQSQSSKMLTPFLKKYHVWCWKQFSNIGKIQASLLSIMPPMGESFSFHVPMLIVYLSKQKNSACVKLPRVMTFLYNLNLTKCRYFLWLYLKLFQFLWKTYILILEVIVHKHVSTRRHAGTWARKVG